jgi:hypothetical protein
MHHAIPSYLRLSLLLLPWLLLLTMLIVPRCVLHCGSEGRLKQGVDIISELIAAGEGQFAKMGVDTAGKLASMFDRYAWLGQH